MVLFIVLSIVFQIYIHAMKLIRERSFSDRQEALNLAFLALRRENVMGEDDENQADIKDVRNVLKLLRPHYDDEKVRSFRVFIQIICTPCIPLCIEVHDTLLTPINITFTTLKHID